MSRIQLRDVLNLSSMNGGERHTVGVMINFTLDKDVLTSAPENTFLYGTFTGNDFTTQIKGRCTHSCHISASKVWLITLSLYNVQCRLLPTLSSGGHPQPPLDQHKGNIDHHCTLPV